MSDESRPLKYALHREAATSRPQHFLIDYQSELNPAQYEAAITHQGSSPNAT